MTLTSHRVGRRPGSQVILSPGAGKRAASSASASEVGLQRELSGF